MLRLWKLGSHVIHLHDHEFNLQNADYKTLLLRRKKRQQMATIGTNTWAILFLKFNL